MPPNNSRRSPTASHASHDVTVLASLRTGSKKRGYIQSNFVSSVGFGTLTTSTLKTALLSLIQR